MKDKNKVMIATTAGSSDITGKACSPNHIQWTWDTWSNSHGTAEAVDDATLRERLRAYVWDPVYLPYERIV